jgi:membrane protein
MLVAAIAAAPFVALGPRKIAEQLPESWDNVLAFGYYPLLFVTLLVGVTILYRVSLPEPLPSHRLVLGSLLATVVFLLATLGLRFYLTWITSTGYTYGALATPIAFLLFAFFLGFAIMIGAELNAAVQEEWPAHATHAKRLRLWLGKKAESFNGSGEARGSSADAAAAEAPAAARADGATS